MNININLQTHMTPKSSPKIEAETSIQSTQSLPTCHKPVLTALEDD